MSLITPPNLRYDLELCMGLCVAWCWSKPWAKQEEKWSLVPSLRWCTKLVCCIQTELLKPFCVSGGDEPREAQLGASQRGPACPDNSGGHTQPGQDQTPAGHQRGQETSHSCCEYQLRTPRRRMLWTGLMEKQCVTGREFTVLVCMEGGRGLSVQNVCVWLCLFVFCVCVSVCIRVYV